MFTPYSSGGILWTLDGTPHEKVSKEIVDQAARSEVIARTQFLQDIVQSGATAKQLNQYRLEDLYQIRKMIDPSSELYQKILAQEDKGLSLSAIREALNPNSHSFYEIPRDFPKETLKFRPEFLEHLFDKNLITPSFQGTDLAGVQLLTDLIGKDEPTIKRVAELEEKVSLLKLGHFVSLNPERRVPVVQSLLHSQNPARTLHTNRLSGLEALQDTYGSESPVLKYLLDNEPEDILGLDRLAAVVKNPILANRLERMVAEGEPIRRMQADNLHGLVYLELKYKENPELLKQFLSLESEKLSLHQLTSMLSPENNDYGSSYKNEFPTQASDFHDDSSRLTESLLKQVQAKDKSLLELDFNELRALHRLSQHFKDPAADSPVMQQIIRLSESGLSARQLREFVDEDPQHHTEMVQAMLQNGATAKDLNYERLQSISVLIQKLHPNKERFDHLFELEKQGLKLSELKDYLSEDEKKRVPQITGLLDQHATVKQMNVRYLRDAEMVEALRTHFPGNEPILASIKEMQEEGLSASRLIRWIDGNRLHERAWWNRL